MSLMFGYWEFLPGFSLLTEVAGPRRIHAPGAKRLSKDCVQNSAAETIRRAGYRH